MARLGLDTAVSGQDIGVKSQVVNILTLGNGKGVFFPNGVNGNITSPEGYDQQAYGFGVSMACVLLT
jgi:hypothetical protein